MLIPIKPISTVAMVTKIRPPIAEVMISLAALTLSGDPADIVRRVKP